MVLITNNVLDSQMTARNSRRHPFDVLVCYYDPERCLQVHSGRKFPERKFHFVRASYCCLFVITSGVK